MLFRSPVVLKGHAQDVNSAAFSPDGARIVTASDDSTARVWSADGQGEPVVLKGHHRAVTSAAFSTDGDRIFTESNDLTLRVWWGDGRAEMVVSRENNTLEIGHNGSTRDIFRPDGRDVVTYPYGEDGTVWLLDISALARTEEPDLAAKVCQETASVAHILTAKDIRDLPILQGREGEDV